MPIGFESVKSSLLGSYNNQKLHHAILLCGKKGIGKSSFAKEFCLEILGSKNPTHPDILVIEKEAEKRDINVEKVRKIAAFLNQTSSSNKDKFIIIDSACELNKSAANALLKILEEPHKNNFLILVAHNLNRVLPTIRSRCQMVKVNDLSLSDFEKVLQLQKLKFPANEINFIAEICENSPAIAINCGADLSRFYQLFLRSILNKKISDELLKNISDKNFSFTIFEKSCEFFFTRLLKIISGAEVKFFFEEEKVFMDLAQKFPKKKIFAIMDEAMISLHKTPALYLDKKLCLINIFNRISYE